MSQDTFMMFAAAAVLKADRLDALKKEQGRLRKTKFSNVPVLQTVDEAYRDIDLGVAIGEIEEEMRSLAIEMRDCGAPEGVWIRYPQESGRDVMLRITDTDPPKLAVNDYTGP